jgi:hypothetical protein
MNSAPSGGHNAPICFYGLVGITIALTVFSMTSGSPRHSEEFSRLISKIVSGKTLPAPYGRGLTGRDNLLT